MELTVLLPARDEEESLRELLPGIRAALEPLEAEFEILVVDGGSRDGTVSASRAAGARVVVQKEPGYGGAFREGIREARGRYLLVLDADGSHDPADIPRLLELREKAEVVIGSRYVPGGRYRGPAFRHLLSRILNAVFRHALGLPFRDLSSGFRLYRTRALKELDLRSEKFDVLEEALFLLHRRGATILEIPVVYHERKAGKSKARLMSFAPAYLKTLLRLRKLEGEEKQESPPPHQTYTLRGRQESPEP